MKTKFFPNEILQTRLAAKKRYSGERKYSRTKSAVFFLSILLLCSVQHAWSQQIIRAKLQGSPVDTSGWTFYGTTAIQNIKYADNSEIKLTDNGNYEAGAVFYRTPVQLAKCGGKWAAEFDFRIFDGSGADGLSFCFLDSITNDFNAGGGIGIPATSNGLKVVFDTYPNCDGGPMPKIELRWGTGYNECDTMPTRYNTDDSLSVIRSDDYNHAKISYDNGNINIYLNDHLFLSGYQQFNFSGYVGFTAATGGASDFQSIRNVVIYTECGKPTKLKSSNITANTATLNWAPVSCGIGYAVQYRVAGTTTWTRVKTTATSINIAGLTSATTYQWKVQTVCIKKPVTVSTLATGKDFTTLPAAALISSVQESDLITKDAGAFIRPNPAKASADLVLNTVPRNTTITITDFSGKVLWKKDGINQARTSLPVEKMAAGVYLITISGDGKTKALKLVKE